jgi:hypothetical protein
MQKSATKAISNKVPPTAQSVPVPVSAPQTRSAAPLLGRARGKGSIIVMGACTFTDNCTDGLFTKCECIYFGNFIGGKQNSEAGLGLARSGSGRNLTGASTKVSSGGVGASAEDGSDGGNP